MPGRTIGSGSSLGPVTVAAIAVPMIATCITALKTAAPVARVRCGRDSNS